MNNATNVIGIDVSKLKIDVFEFKGSKRSSFPNDAKGFTLLRKWLPDEGYFVCFENTGYYSLALAVFLQQNSIPFSMVSPLQIKRSLGL